MEKAKAKSFCGPFTSSKSALTVILLVTVICVISYIAGRSYAAGSGQMAVLSTAVKTNTVIDSSEISKNKSADKWQIVSMRVTAYCPCQKCCGDYADGITACGYKISQGDVFVAADKKYPFGTEMFIPGYGHGEAVKVLDRGGVIRGNRLDVFFNSHEEALEWGVRYLDVKIRYR